MGGRDEKGRKGRILRGGEGGGGEKTYRESPLVAPVVPSVSASVPAGSLELGDPLIEFLLVFALQEVASSARVVHLKSKRGILLGLGESGQIHPLIK